MAAVALSCSSSNDLVSQDSVEWAANLPSDVMFLILDKLFKSTDHVRLAAVCKRWNSAAKDYSKHSPSLVPMLMIPKKESQEQHREEAQLYSVTEEKLYNSFQFQIPRCSLLYYGIGIKLKGAYSGTGHGWLARVVDPPTNSLRITLLNPFTSQGTTSSIALPQLFLQHAARNLSRLKIVLSADPTLNPDNYVVILLCWGRYDSELAFLVGGGKSWTRVRDYRVSDAIYYKGRGYAIDHPGPMSQLGYSNVVTFDVKGSSDFPQQPRYPYTQWQHDYRARTDYLVESTEGDLLCVRRYYRPQKCSSDRLWRTERFTVYKLVLDDKDGSAVMLVEVKNIGDNALFLGSNSQSVSVIASKHPGCRSNCIYYTNDLHDLTGLNWWKHDDTTPLDMGIFNMEDGTITQLCPQIPWNEHGLSPLWITPTFNGLSIDSS